MTGPAPLPPARPAHLALGPEPIGSPEVTASIDPLAAGPAASTGDAQPLPSVITRGLITPPTGAALALVEVPRSAVADDGALLSRAAELTAPLPPMPIPDAAPPPPRAEAAPAPRADGRKTGFLAEVARVFGFRSERDPDGLRGSQQ